MNLQQVAEKFQAAGFRAEPLSTATGIQVFERENGRFLCHVWPTELAEDGDHKYWYVSLLMPKNVGRQKYLECCGVVNEINGGI